MNKYPDFLSAITNLETKLRENEYLREIFFSLPIGDDLYNVKPPAKETEMDRYEVIKKIDEQVIAVLQKDISSRKASVTLSYPDTGLGRCLSSIVFWTENKKLYCTAFFRSMSLILFPYDYETLSCAAMQIINKMNLNKGELHIFIVNLYNQPVLGVKETSWRDFLDML